MYVLPMCFMLFEDPSIAQTTSLGAKSEDV